MKPPIAIVLVVMLAAAFASGCSQSQSRMDHQAAQPPAVQHVQLTDSLQASQYENLFFAAQPALTDFATLKDQGFVHVINMRRPSEHDEQAESYQVRFHGMRYDNLPFGPDDALTDAYLQKLIQAIQTNSNRGKVLIHCSSSNRAGMAAGAYLSRQQGVTPEQAKAIATDAGMQSSMAPKLDAYLDAQR